MEHLIKNKITTSFIKSHSRYCVTESKLDKLANDNQISIAKGQIIINITKSNDKSDTKISHTDNDPNNNPMKNNSPVKNKNDKIKKNNSKKYQKEDKTK